MKDITTILITALLVLLMAGSAMGATPELVEAPRNDVTPTETVIIDGHACGFIPPAHVSLTPRETGHWKTMGEPRMGQLPDAWDWRDHGGVSSVKDQGLCGSCYAFAFAGQAESAKMCIGSGEVNLSENDIKEWNHLEAVGYGCPSNCWGSCDGGNALMCANLYSKWGSVNEEDDPYVPWDVSRHTNRGRPQDVFTEWHLMSGDSIPSPDDLKAVVYEQPVYTSVNAYALPGNYDGTSVITNGSGSTNHAVMIVGWNDTMCPDGTGAWVCKNSWNYTWGDEGFFYIKYGVAGIGKWTSYSTKWHEARADDRLYFNDEAGWWNSWGWWGDDDVEMVVEYVPGCDNATAIEFWATDDCMVDVALYATDPIDGLVTPLPNSARNGTYNDAGYYSIEFEHEVYLANGVPVYVYVHINGPNFPIPTEGGVGPREAIGSQWVRRPGGVWQLWDPEYTSDSGSICGDLGVRMRTITRPCSPVPEIPTLAAVGLGICMIGIFARRKP